MIMDSGKDIQESKSSTVVVQPIDEFQIPEKVNPDIIPKWIDSKYEGMEQDIEEWLVSHYFWKRWDGKKETLENTVLKARAIAQARYETLVQTGVLKNAADKSIMYQLVKARSTNWYRYFNEISDIEELLESALHEAIEKNPDGGNRYDIEFMVNTLLPTLKQMGVSTELIIGVPQNISKAKVASPLMKRIIKEGGDEVEERLVEVLKDIADPQVTWRQLHEKNAIRMGREQPSILKGSVYFVSNKEIIVIESDRSHTQLIERALKGIVENLSVSDGVALMRYLSQVITPGAAMIKKYIVKVVDDDHMFVESDHGLQLPTPERFNILALEELARSKELVEDLLSMQGWCLLPLFTLQHTDMLEILKTIELTPEDLDLSVDDDFPIEIKKIVDNSYYIDKSIAKVLDSNVELMSFFRCNSKGEYQLCLHITKKG